MASIIKHETSDPDIMLSLISRIYHLQKNRGSKEASILILRQCLFYFMFVYYLIRRYWTGKIDDRHDPFKIVCVDPNEITYVSLRDSNANRWIGSGTTEGGQWDLSEKKFETESDWYRTLEARFVDNKCWQEIEFVQEQIKDVNRGETVWNGCTSEKEIFERCEEIDALYYDIKRNGYKSKQQLLKTNIDDPIDTIQTNALLRPLDEVAVDIGRNGDFLFVDGRHRLSIAKIVGVEEIPVRIVVRHEKWQEFREQVYRFVDQFQDGSVRYELPHPDLQGINTLLDSEECFDLLINEFNLNDAIVFDFQPGLGGSLSTRFDQIGFKCYAFQTQPDKAEILNRFKRITDSNYEIVSNGLDTEKFVDQHLIGIFGDPSRVPSSIDDLGVEFDELYLISDDDWISKTKDHLHLSLIDEVRLENDVILYKIQNICR